MIGIYKITSPTGRIYIGQSIDIEKRFKGYKSMLNMKSQTLLRRSFLKYGVENHKFEVIEECTVEELNERERYWQDKYDVLNSGLNCRLTKSNDKSAVISEKTRKKMSVSARKKEFTKDHRKNISIAVSGKKNPFYGKKHSEDTKKNLSIISKNNGFFSGENNPMYNSMRFGELNPFYGKKHSKENKDKIRSKAIGRKFNESTIEIFSKQRLLGLNSSAKLVLNLETGIYYSCCKEASFSINHYKYSTLKSKLNGSSSIGNNTSFTYV